MVQVGCVAASHIGLDRSAHAFHHWLADTNQSTLLFKSTYNVMVRDQLTNHIVVVHQRRSEHTIAELRQPIKGIVKIYERQIVQFRPLLPRLVRDDRNQQGPYQPKRRNNQQTGSGKWYNPYRTPIWHGKQRRRTHRFDPSSRSGAAYRRLISGERRGKCGPRRLKLP
jgi:hypothetical protein